jgi:hypothetical protein
MAMKTFPLAANSVPAPSLLPPPFPEATSGALLRWQADNIKAAAKAAATAPRTVNLFINFLPTHLLF